MHLVLRRANAPRISGRWQDEDYGVFDGERQTRFWSVSFQLTGRKSYGYATSPDEAKAAFRAEYEAWKGS
jgi:hypothetical protein